LEQGWPNAKCELSKHSFGAANLKVSDWLAATGMGVENEEALKQEYVSRLCPCYYKSEPVIMDRASIQPQFDSSDLRSLSDGNKKGRDKL